MWNTKKLGRLLREAREEAALSQAELGRRVGAILDQHQPVTDNTVSRWERGQTNIAAHYIFAVESALGLPPGHFNYAMHPLHAARSANRQAWNDALDSFLGQNPALAQALPRSLERDLRRLDIRLPSHPEVLFFCQIAGAHSPPAPHPPDPHQGG